MILSSGTELTYNPWYYYLGNKLIRKRKPCLPGQQVHLISRQGCFTVHDVKIDHFVIHRNRKPVEIPWSDFSCLKGEGHSLEAIVKRDLRAAVAMANTANARNAELVSELTALLKSMRKL